MTIAAKHHNSLIGAKGRLIRSIIDDCGQVQIHFPQGNSKSDDVHIRGPAADVAKAKEQLMSLAQQKVMSVVFGYYDFSIYYKIYEINNFIFRDCLGIDRLYC